jgi:hypothetical protein
VTVRCPGARIAPTTGSWACAKTRLENSGKKIKGRKRHLLVDTLGLLVAILITGEGINDGVAALKRLAKLSPDNFPRLVIIFGDSKYHHHNLQA